ncbi:nucleoside hydrolase [Sphaerochaeta halotolerans]|uniref:nucleoside hydrolase n=1 Tax=Sphaerochaeta halotolerans TaxID=2293840 RepID=UPI00136D8B78|nr:nucleoside hydrolase [Sphaerochaeta halotolerans]MXI87526.1 nucleoside hydrolase [Sphaerochaeta halotolerans]
MRYTNYAFGVPEEKIIRVIIDTDAKNEADDQFAIVHAVLSPKLEHVGFIAAHYGIDRHQDSMKRSFNELETIFKKMQLPWDSLCVHGAERPMETKYECRTSEGSSLIVQEAMKDDPRPLYVLFLGPLTDLAAAYLQEPRIANRLTAIWIGGGAYPSGGPEFNLGNDIIAANVVFSSPIALWQVPKNVYEMMPVSFAELQQRVYGKGEIGRYLFEQLNEHAHEPIPLSSAFRTGESWVLGDSPAVGLLLYEHRFSFDWVEAPIIGSGMQYIHTKQNRPIRVYRSIDSRLILDDFYAKLSLFAQD